MGSYVGGTPLDIIFSFFIILPASNIPTWAGGEPADDNYVFVVGHEWLFANGVSCNPQTSEDYHIVRRSLKAQQHRLYVHVFYYTFSAYET